MKIFCLFTDKVEGFSFTNNIDEEVATWAGSTVSVIDIGEGEEEAVRQCVDYMTALKDGNVAIFDESQIVFTSRGQEILNGYK